MASSRPFRTSSAPIVIPLFARGRSCATSRRPLCGPIGSPGDIRMQLKVAEASRLQPRDRLIVALDTPDVSDARWLVGKLGESAAFYKIGMELAYGGGLPLVSELAAAGKQIF